MLALIYFSTSDDADKLLEQYPKGRCQAFSVIEEAYAYVMGC